MLGVLADRWGRKRVLGPSLVLYAVAGGSCIFARDFDLLPSLRFIQGIGGALGHTLGTVIMGTEFLFGGVNLVFVVGLMGLFMVPLSALCLG
ncbi:MAG: MFS transporter [Thermoplasmatota archaeon]